ncbi:hypothetical protein PPRFG01_0045800 [Plasmodium sp.]|nr:hypothetical protein PPRFG01_0045800 [Plasmodium sp.]
MTYILFTQEIKNSCAKEHKILARHFVVLPSNRHNKHFLKQQQNLQMMLVSMAKLAETEALDAATPALTTYTNAIMLPSLKKKMNKKEQYTKLLKE